MKNPILWPKRYVKFYNVIRFNKDLITKGKLISIDPASGGKSLPGFAVFNNGKLVQKGFIELPSKMPVAYRLRVLYSKLSVLVEDADVLAIEEIRGNMGHVFLLWSVGVAVCAIKCKVLIEVPINVWRALAKADPLYQKADDEDAYLIGKALIVRAEENL